jgi:hemerythrin
MESIKHMMDEQHKRLINLLEEFLRQFKEDAIKSGLVLEKFKWMVNKHFSIEELAIFNTYESMNSENVGSTFQLMQEHQEIIALFNKIQNELGDKVKEEVRQLEDLLKRHGRFEDETFYPRLDEMLNENQKLEIIAKIKEKIVS